MKVRIESVETMQNKETKEFFQVFLVVALVLRMSGVTGRPYFDKKTVRITTPLNYEEAQAFIGEEVDGTVKEVPCKPYKWVRPSDGKEIERSTTWSLVSTQHQQVVEEEA